MNTRKYLRIRILKYSIYPLVPSQHLLIVAQKRLYYCQRWIILVLALRPHPKAKLFADPHTPKNEKDSSRDTGPVGRTNNTDVVEVVVGAQHNIIQVDIRKFILPLSLPPSLARWLLPANVTRDHLVVQSLELEREENYGGG